MERLPHQVWLYSKDGSKMFWSDDLPTEAMGWYRTPTDVPDPVEATDETILPVQDATTPHIVPTNPVKPIESHKIDPKLAETQPSKVAKPFSLKK